MVDWRRIKSLGKMRSGADFNSLAHMISTDLLVSVHRRSPPFARAKRSLLQRCGCGKNRPKRGGCRGCFGSKGTRQSAGPARGFPARTGMIEVGVLRNGEPLLVVGDSEEQRMYTPEC